MAKLTVYDIRRLKGVRQLTEIFTRNPDEAAAANEAGIDMIATDEYELQMFLDQIGEDGA